MQDLIAVIGSLNRDIVISVASLPAPGETVHASEIRQFRGGKGANQAIAAARLGRNVAMIGRVGADADGTGYLRNLVAEGVDVAGVAVDIDLPTGSAYILLDAAGENSIAVVAGANGRVTPEDVAAAADHVERAAVTMAQLEVPLDAVKAAAQLAGGVFVLNAAPAQHLGPELLSLVDVLVVNRSELARLVDSRQAGQQKAIVAQARRVNGPRAVVATLGAAGALVVTADDAVPVRAPSVTPRDTTGAGDAFCGGLADALARKEDLVSAVRWAVVVGAAATQKLGAQTGMPTAAEATELLHLE